MATTTYDGGYSTHIEALTWAALSTTGPIVEWGCGYYSTPLLHSIAEVQGRRLYTMESQPGWLELFEPWENDFHFLNAVLVGTPGLVFIDDEAHMRPVHLNESYAAQLVVVHDTEPQSAVNYPGMHEAMDEYLYRRDYTYFEQWTTILSNTVEL